MPPELQSRERCPRHPFPQRKPRNRRRWRHCGSGKPELAKSGSVKPIEEGPSRRKWIALAVAEHSAAAFRCVHHAAGDRTRSRGSRSAHAAVCGFVEPLRGDAAGTGGPGLCCSAHAAKPERVHTENVVAAANGRHRNVPLFRVTQLGSSGAAVAPYQLIESRMVGPCGLEPQTSTVSKVAL